MRSPNLALLGIELKATNMLLSLMDDGFGKVFIMQNHANRYIEYVD